MKLTHYLYIIGALSFFTACDDDLTRPDAGIDDDAIALMAGISTDSHDALTRGAGSSVLENANHGKHLAFTKDTKAALQINGTWKEHSPEAVTITTTATIGAETTTDSKHNSIELSPKVYWNDFGTADPANMDPVEGNGREKGLTIYGVAVNGVADAPTVSSWTALPWSVVADQTSGWSAKDLLISNNVKPGGPDDTYKFKEKSAGKVLEFKHAMSKMTVILTAGEGFVGGVFVAEPLVTLLNFNTAGSVNVTDGSLINPGTIADIITYCENGTKTVQNTVTRTALVFPGNEFVAIIAADDKKTPTSTTEILKITADGNVYYVTAAQLVKAIAGAGATGTVKGKLESGKNYILQVTINKTEIKVTATIMDWIDVEAEVVAPKIDVKLTQGNGGTPMDDNEYRFYISESKDNGYGVAKGSDAIYYEQNAAIAYDKTNKVWALSPHLYWPSHDTHYLMRGVWPQTGAAGNTDQKPVVVKDAEKQYIALNNVAYSKGTYPSDLMLGAPDITATDKCQGETHTPVVMSENGICATEDSVHMVFRYMMSQVEVNLSTTEGDDKVNIGADTKVEIVNVYTTGNAEFGNVAVVTTGSKTNYELASVTDNDLKRHSAVIPQPLTFSEAGATTNVRFRVTVTNADNTTDVYYADIKPIKKAGSTDLVAPNGKWESGVHYVYNLMLKKTEISVTAKIVDWITVTAEENIWF